MILILTLASSKWIYDDDDNDDYFGYDYDLSLPLVQQVNDCSMQPGPLHWLSAKVILQLFHWKWQIISIYLLASESVNMISETDANQFYGTLFLPQT